MPTPPCGFAAALVGMGIARRVRQLCKAPTATAKTIASSSFRYWKRLVRVFPLGHVHTQALRGYDAAFERDIVDQVRCMIVAALYSLPTWTTQHRFGCRWPQCAATLRG